MYGISYGERKLHGHEGMDGINLELHLQRTLEIKLVYSPRTQCPSAMEKEAA